MLQSELETTRCHQSEDSIETKPSHSAVWRSWQSVGPWLDTLGLSGVGPGSHLKVWVWSMKRLHDLQKLKVQKVHSQVLPLPLGHWAIGPLGHWVEGEGCEDLWRSVEIWIAGIANPLAFWCVLCLVQFQSFRSDFQPSKYESPFIVSLFALIFSLLSQLSKEPWFWYYLILYVLALVRVWGTGKPKLIERFKC